MRKAILQNIKKANPSNPLEYVRELVAPLCKEKLNQFITGCSDCASCNNYSKSLAHGNPNANYLIINDNATDDKDVDGFLEEIIASSGIDKNDIFIINSISCILKKKLGDEEIIRLPSRIEVKNCKHFVDYAIDFVSPRVIICMGSTGLAMYRQDISFEDIKGNFIEINGIKTMITYSSKDIYTMNNYYTEKEIDDIIIETIANMEKAKKYVDILE